MDEGDSAPSGTHARRFVDQLIAGPLASGQGGIQIADPIADMVDPGSPASQESCDGAFRFPWGEELDFGFAKSVGSDGRPVGGFGGMRLEGEDVAIERQCSVQIGHGDPDMSDPGAISHAILSGDMNRNGINP